MGGLFESKTKTTGRQSTQVPLNFSQLMDRTISFANQGLDTPFQSYNAPRIAELSANEQAGIAGAGANAGMYQPLIDMAMTNNASMQAQGGVPTAGDLNQFINPYTDYVLNNSLSRLNEQSDFNMTKIGSNAAMSGAFGGSRHGVLEGANLAELLKSSGELSANTYSDAFDKGMGNWFKSQDLRRGGIQDALNIAGQGSAYNRGDTQNLMNTGLVGRTRDQSVLDFAYSEFMREQQDPFTKAGFASSVMSSYPTNLFTRDTSSTTTNTPSPFSQIAGIGLAAAGLATGNPAALAGLGAGQQSLGPATNAFESDFMNYNGYNPQTGKPPGFAKGGRVKTKFSGGGFLDSILGGIGFGYLNNQNKSTPQGPQTQPRNAVEALSMGQSQNNISPLNALMSRGVFHKQGGMDQPQTQPQDYVSQQRQPFDWTSFYQRQGLDRIPTAQSNVNPEYLGRGRPDLSQFMQMLQQRVSGNGAQGGSLPTPPFQQSRFAKGGSISGKYYENTKGRRQSTNVEERRGKTVQTKAAREASQIPEKASLPTWAMEAFGLSPWDFRTDVEAQKYHAIKNYNKVMARSLAEGRGFDLNDVEQAIVDRAMDDKVNANSALAIKYGSKLDPDPQRGAKSIPSLYAEGGRVEDDATTILSLLGGNQKSSQASHPNFVPTDDPYTGGNSLPIKDLIDRNRIFRLALQKHETGAAEYDKPNYFANSFKGKENSHAFGLGQWQPDTYNKLVREWNANHPKDQLTTISQADVKADKLPTKTVQDKIWSIWEPKILASHGNNPTLAFAEHQLGGGDLSKVLRADGNDRMASVVGGQIAKNVSASNETVNQYLKRLGGMYNDAYKWEYANLVNKGGNLTDVVKGGSVAPEDATSLLDMLNRTPKVKGDKQVNKALVDAGIPLAPFQAPPNNNDPLAMVDALGRPTAAAMAMSDRHKYEAPNDPDAYKRRLEAASHVPGSNTNEILMNSAPYNSDRRVDGPAGRGKPKTFNSPLEVLIGNQPPPIPQDYLDSRIEGIPEDAMLPDFTQGGYRNISQKDIDRMLREAGIPTQPFMAPRTNYKGGGYVKGYAGGGDVMSRGMNFWDALTNFKVKPIDHNNAFKSVFGEQQKQPTSVWDQVPATSPDLESIRNPWSGSGIFGGPPPSENGTTPEQFNSALEEGDPSAIVSEPAQQNLKEDALTTALKQMIMQEIENRKNNQEPDPNKFLGMNVNMPLLKMGLGILANSGYPNSAGEAIGKGVLGALTEDEQRQLDKSKRNNDKLKELINLRYMQGMVESMDPNIKMQLERERAAQDITKAKIEADLKAQSQIDYYNATRGSKLEDALTQIRARNESINPFGEDEGINVD